MADTLIGIAWFAWAPFGCLLVGVLYYAVSNRAFPVSQRALTSAFAPAAVLPYLAAALLPPGMRSTYLEPVYPVLQAVPLGLLVISLFKFPGPRWAHAILLPIALVCMAWQAVWGYFGVYGK